MLVYCSLESAMSINSVQIPSRVIYCNWAFGCIFSMCKLNRGAVVCRLPECCFRKLCSSRWFYSWKSWVFEGAHLIQPITQLVVYPCLVFSSITFLLPVFKNVCQFIYLFIYFLCITYWLECWEEIVKSKSTTRRCYLEMFELIVP